jgi:hypothetical protein
VLVAREKSRVEDVVDCVVSPGCILLQSPPLSHFSFHLDYIPFFSPSVFAQQQSPYIYICVCANNNNNPLYTPNDLATPWTFFFYFSLMCCVASDLFLLFWLLLLLLLFLTPSL